MSSKTPCHTHCVQTVLKNKKRKKCSAREFGLQV